MGSEMDEEEFDWQVDQQVPVDENQVYIVRCNAYIHVVIIDSLPMYQGNGQSYNCTFWIECFLWCSTIGP